MQVMRGWAACAVVPLAIATGVSSAATPPPASLFPFADGNRWTLRERTSGAPMTISMRGRPGAFVLHRFPGLEAVRVRRVRGSVEAWDSADRRWEPFLRLSASVGTRYRVDLAGSVLWESVDVAVASKRALVRDYRGRVLRRCTRLTFRYRSPIADAGLEQLSFAPGIGPVSVSETTIAGTRERVLASFRVRRQQR
jgi:hypothetical protein